MDSGILDEIERTRAWCLSMAADQERLEAEIARLRETLVDVIRSAREHGLNTCADFCEKALNPEEETP